MNKVLFLCDQNLCGSRIAEILFNHHAGPDSAGYQLTGWTAESRGLELSNQSGKRLSENAFQFLRERQVNIPSPRWPLAAQPADRIVALYEPAHRPLIEARFPQWANRVEFWNVPDFHLSDWKIGAFHPNGAAGTIGSQYP
ncbi:MAG: low molecular weight phosphatase family protein [Planctomycetota bacterium]|nr:low molecular weight phosphatase family protein [Planctomycetota bacterium]